MPLYLIAILLVCTLSGCFVPKVIKQEQVFFNEIVAGNEQVSQHLLEVEDDRLFYAASGDPLKPALIIIHGTPGDWQQYARFLLNTTLLQHFYIIVVDRPGWGQSTLGGDRQVASFSEQAKILSVLSNQLKQTSQGQPVILMGHSLGASLAPKVAMEYPESVDALLLLAGTLSPSLSEPRWFNHVADTTVFGFLIGDELKKSNEEIMVLKSEMTAMAPYWKSLRAETIVVQGMQDKLVYPSNIDFAEKEFNPEMTEVIRLEQDGHLFPMTRRDDVVLWATCLLKKLSVQSLYCQQDGVAIDNVSRKN